MLGFKGWQSPTRGTNRRPMHIMVSNCSWYAISTCRFCYSLIMLGQCQAPEQSANSIASYISQPNNNLLLLLKFTILNLLVYNMYTITVPWQNTRTALVGLLPKLHGGTYLLQPDRYLSAVSSPVKREYGTHAVSNYHS